MPSPVLSDTPQRNRSAYERARALVFAQVCPEAEPSGLSLVNHLFMVTVMVAVMVQICETEPLLAVPYQSWFILLDRVVGVLFFLDLVLRIWAAGEMAPFAGARGRLRYLRRPRVIIDVLAVLPYLLSSWIGFLDANDLAFLRLVTAMEILVNARLGKLSSALRAMRFALRARWGELVIGLVVAVVVMVCAAVGLYLAERHHQPNSFGSVLRALWWSLETLTTVGYGDVLPRTVLGKVCAGLFAVAGIGIVAIPAGVLAAAFGEAFMAEKLTPGPGSNSPPQTPGTAGSPAAEEDTPR